MSVWWYYYGSVNYELQNLGQTKDTNLCCQYLKDIEANNSVKIQLMTQQKLRELDKERDNFKIWTPEYSSCMKN